MIAVIGSKGFIGKHLINHFSSQKLQYIEYSSKDGNLVNEESLLSSDFDLPEGCDTVIFLSQSPHYRDFPEGYSSLIKVNTLLPFEIAKKAIEKGVKKFIYFSSGSVYSQSLEPLNEASTLNRTAHYPLSKIQSEECLKLLSDKINICCVRPFGVYGPGQKNMLIPNLINNIQKNKTIFLDKVSGKHDADGLNISLIYISDLVAALGQIIRFDVLPFTLNLSSTKHYSIREISKIIGESLNKSVNYEVNETVYRKGNLIADCRELNNLYDLGDCISLAEGISAVLEYGRDD